MPEVEPRFKDPGAWKCRKDDETCTRAKPCRSCLGARNRRSGMRKQRDARKALERVTGKEAARFVGQLGNEESWRLPVLVEVKSGAQVGPIWTRFALAETQAKSNKNIGDNRPFVFVAMGQRTTDGLFVCRLSELGRVTEALVNELS